MSDEAEGIDNLSPDHDGDGPMDSDAAGFKSNYKSRFIEVSRFIGAPAQGAFYWADIDRADTNEEVTADIQIGNVIGNGVGFVVGLGLHYLSWNYYRTGSHELFWVASEPTAATISKLGIKADGADVRFGGKLYYVNNLTKTCTPLEVDEKDFSSYFDKMKINSSMSIPKETIKSLSDKIKNHTPCSGRPSTNPLYRNFKTLANFGWQVGATISNFLGIEDPNKKRLISCIMSDICCFVIGLIAFPYWLIREKILKIPPNTRHKYAVTGGEGWSKYLRTALAFGIAVGQGIGGLIASVFVNASTAVVSFSITFWGGIVGMGSFLLGLIAVPLINWSTSRIDGLSLMADDEKILPSKVPKNSIVLKNYQGQIKAFVIKGSRVERPVDLRLDGAEKKFLLDEFAAGKGKVYLSKTDHPKLVDTIASQCTLGALASDDKNYIRNNYTRSGMTLGAGVGALLGLLVGNWCFGLVLAGIIFSALGTVVGGAVFSFTSHKLHRRMHPMNPKYKLYLLPEGETIDPEKLPDKGKMLIILKKEGTQVKAYSVRKPNNPINLRLTIEELNALQFPAAGKNGVTITQTDNKDLVDIIYTQTEDLENSWDYVTRSTASIFGFIGAAVVCLINPAAALLLVPIGSAIAGAIGWGLGILIMRRAQKLNDEEPRAQTLPWTQRITTGANIGSIVGGAIGILVGLAGFVFAGPASIILAVSFFGAVGAVIGGICGALWDQKARALIWEGIKNLFVTPSPPGPDLNHNASTMSLNSLNDPSSTSRGSSPMEGGGLTSTAQAMSFLPSPGTTKRSLITKQPKSVTPDPNKMSKTHSYTFPPLNEKRNQESQTFKHNPIKPRRFSCQSY